MVNVAIKYKVETPTVVASKHLFLEVNRIKGMSMKIQGQLLPCTEAAASYIESGCNVSSCI